MINTIFLILIVVIFFLLNFLLNLRAKKAYENKNYSILKTRFFPIIIIFVLLLAVYTVPNNIANNIEYSSFDSFMFWAEGRVGDKEPFGVQAKIQINDNYIYSLGDNSLSGVLLEQNGKFQKGTIKQMKNKGFRSNDEMYSFSLYHIKELNTNILIISYFYDGSQNKINIIVDDKETNEYYNSSGKSAKYILCDLNIYEFNIKVGEDNFIW